MISGAGLCWQHVGGVGSTTTTTTTKYGQENAKTQIHLFDVICRDREENKN